MAKPVKSENRKVKLVVFMVLVGMTAAFSVLLKLLFPDASASAITIQSADAGKPANGAETSEPAECSDVAAETTAGRAEDLIPIYLVGAIKMPGVYWVARGSYLFELVERAGGLSEDAADDRINLAFCLEANQRIWLPTQQEADDPSAGSAGSTGGVEWPDETVSKRIDINQADAALLDSLPGIGPATAADIVAYRESQGAFKKTEDVMNVPGIKESRFARLKDLICVTGRP